jgi:hypothetical protein
MRDWQLFRGKGEYILLRSHFRHGSQPWSEIYENSPRYLWSGSYSGWACVWPWIWAQYAFNAGIKEVPHATSNTWTSIVRSLQDYGTFRRSVWLGRLSCLAQIRTCLMWKKRPSASRLQRANDCYTELPFKKRRRREVVCRVNELVAMNRCRANSKCQDYLLQP